MNTLLLLFFYIFCKIREFVFVNCEVLVVFHIVNVKIYAVERNLCIIITFDYAVNGSFVGITPTALLIAECPERRNVTLTDCTAELFYNVNRLIALVFDNVDVKICTVNSDFCAAWFCVTDVPTDFCGEINKNTESLAAAEHKEVVCGIQ